MLTRLLLFLPYIGLLWPPFYNRVEPELFGFPFFYWYQMIWIIVGAALLFAVYRFDRTHREASR